MKKIYKILLIYKLLLARILTISAKPNKWIVSEKSDEARDNGYYFFEYCMKYEKNNKNIYYVIDKNSLDYKKVKKISNNIIYTNSLKHCIYYFQSSKLISSQAIPFPISEKICRKYFEVKNQKYYWLQHGITKDFLNPKDVDYKHKRYSLICCGSPYEVDFFKKNYGYNDNQAKLTGFCRFDGLIDKSSKYNYILIMPTFRKYLTTKILNNKPSNSEEKKFIKSDFYIKYNELLSNNELLKFLKENNLKIIFYMHYAFQNYSYLFKNNENDNIIIGTREKYDVQDLMLKSKIMITDYSSVFFDFAYMKKPIMYFQFDDEEFRKAHYKRGYFSYKENGFGPVFKDINETIKYIKKLNENGFKMDKLYNDRLNDFFPEIDDENCKRIYELIYKN